jgi:diaminopimelate epimerase
MTSPPTFSKWHAHGNTYLVGPPLADASPAAVRELVADADGLLEVTPRGEHEAEVVIWNADGSRAEMSGNGTRIAARWLAEQTGAEAVTIRVGRLTVVARMLADGRVETEMGEVEVAAPERIAGLEVVAISVGNPHAVVRGDPADLPLIGPMLERHPRFPNRTNVQVAQLDRPGEITARVWERGVGETASSGTSAVAVAAALDQNPATVRFPGGDLEVRFEGRRAFLTGPAERLE